MASNRTVGPVQRFLAAAQRVIMGVASLAAIVLGFYLAWGDKVTAATACFSVGVILFLLSNIELFESVKAPGFSATMRKLDDKVQEIQALAERVTATSTVTAEFCMAVMARIGRLAGPLPRAQAHELVARMTGELRSLGVTDATVKSLTRPWRDIVTFDLMHPVYESIYEAANKLNPSGRIDLPREPPEAVQAWQERTKKCNEWRSRVSRALGERNLDGLAELRRLREELVAFPEAEFDKDGKVLEAILHAEHYAKHGEFLELSWWLAGDPTTEQSN